MKTRSIDQRTEQLKILALARLGEAGDADLAQKACARLVAFLDAPRPKVISLDKRRRR
jgi:hypothetical protein